MDFIKMLREDNGLSDLLCDVCDIEILPEFKTPQDECGHLAYNISGKTFARAGSGSEYILLEDGSIGFWGSEGACGRIADNLQDFFEFVLNCPIGRIIWMKMRIRNRGNSGSLQERSMRNIWKTKRTCTALIYPKRSRSWRIAWGLRKKQTLWIY